MRMAPGLILVLGLASWVFAGGSKPDVKGGAKARRQANVIFHGSEKTLEILEAAAKEPPENYPEFLRPGETLPMGKPMQYHNDKWLVWWGLITEKGAFEFYAQNRDQDKAISGPVYETKPSEDPLDLGISSMAFDLDDARLALLADGTLHFIYKFSIGIKQQERDIRVKLYNRGTQKREEIKKPGYWLWFSGGNPPNIHMVDPNSPEMREYFKRHPESKPKDPPAAGRPGK